MQDPFKDFDRYQQQLEEFLKLLDGLGKQFQTDPFFDLKNIKDFSYSADDLPLIILAKFLGQTPRGNPATQAREAHRRDCAIADLADRFWPKGAPAQWGWRSIRGQSSLAHRDRKQRAYASEKARLIREGGGKRVTVPHCPSCRRQYEPPIILTDDSPGWAVFAFCEHCRPAYAEWNKTVAGFQAASTLFRPIAGLRPWAETLKKFSNGRLPAEPRGKLEKREIEAIARQARSTADDEPDDFQRMMMTAALMAVADLAGGRGVRFKYEQHGRHYLAPLPSQALNVAEFRTKLWHWANTRLSELIKEELYRTKNRIKMRYKDYDQAIVVGDDGYKVTADKYGVAKRTRYEFPPHAGDPPPSQDFMDRNYRAPKLWRPKCDYGQADSEDESVGVDAFSGTPESVRRNGARLFIQRDHRSPLQPGIAAWGSKDDDQFYPPHVTFPDPAAKYYEERLDEQRREYIENISGASPLFTIDQSATIRACWKIIREYPPISNEALNERLARALEVSPDAVQKRRERLEEKKQLLMVREALDYALPIKYPLLRVSPLPRGGRESYCEDPMTRGSKWLAVLRAIRNGLPLPYVAVHCPAFDGEPRKLLHRAWERCDRCAPSKGGYVQFAPWREHCQVCAWPRGEKYTVKIGGKRRVVMWPVGECRILGCDQYTEAQYPWLPSVQEVPFELSPPSPTLPLRPTAKPLHYDYRRTQEISNLKYTCGCGRPVARWFDLCHICMRRLFVRNPWRYIFWIETARGWRLGGEFGRRATVKPGAKQKGASEGEVWDNVWLSPLPRELSNHPSVVVVAETSDGHATSKLKIPFLAPKVQLSSSFRQVETLWRYQRVAFENHEWWFSGRRKPIGEFLHCVECGVPCEPPGTDPFPLCTECKRIERPFVRSSLGGIVYPDWLVPYPNDLRILGRYGDLNTPSLVIHCRF